MTLRDLHFQRCRVLQIKKKKRGSFLPRCLLPALAAVLLDDPTEGPRREVEVALDREATWPSAGFQFGEDKIAPLLFVAADVAEEAEVAFIWFPFSGEPSPVGPGGEKLAVDNRILNFLLAVKRRQAAAQFFRKQFHYVSSCCWDRKEA